MAWWASLRAAEHQGHGIDGGSTALVPRARLIGPLPLAVATTVALTMIAAAAGLALSNLVNTAHAQLAGGITVQILEASPQRRIEATGAALSVLGRTPGVSAVRPIPKREIDALLAPWLSAGGADAGLDRGDPDDALIPVPALIDAHLDGPVTPARLAQLRAALARVAPSARLDAQASWLQPVFGAITALRWLALALVALLAATMAAAVLLAARVALSAHRGTIEILHILGSTDRQIAALFQRAIGIDAAAGAVTGLVAALVVILGFGHSFAGLGAGLVGDAALSWLDWLVLALIPLAGVGLAMLTARRSVLAALAKLL